MYDELGPAASPIPEQRVDSIADLERELARMRANWTEFLYGLGAGLFTRPVTLERVYRLGRYELLRFLPDLAIREENHIGELIRAPSGELAYLKTFRLSAEQVRRAYLLRMLAGHDWNLDETARAMKVPAPELRMRILRAGFTGLLKSY